MSEILEQELNSSFVTPEREFAGLPLARYSEGSRLLLLQTKAEESTPNFFILAFIHLHILLKKDKRAAIKLAWDKDAFRESVLDWADSLTKEQIASATELVASIFDEAASGSVEPVKTGKETNSGNF